MGTVRSRWARSLASAERCSANAGLCGVASTVSGRSLWSRLSGKGAGHTRLGVRVVAV